MAIILAGGFFLFIDRFLKWMVMNSWSQPKLLNKFLGWKLYLNPGIAFSLRLSNIVIILLTLPMIAAIIALLIKKSKNNDVTTLFAWTFVFAGAISNLIDRILYKHVVDYFLILTSVINLADVMIVVGLIMYLINLKLEIRSTKSEINSKF